MRLNHEVKHNWKLDLNHEMKHVWELDFNSGIKRDERKKIIFNYEIIKDTWN